MTEQEKIQEEEFKLIFENKKIRVSINYKNKLLKFESDDTTLTEYEKKVLKKYFESEDVYYSVDMFMDPPQVSSYNNSFNKRERACLLKLFKSDDGDERKYILYF